MKGVIIYRSKYGSTRQFAQWLREETGFELYEYRGRARVNLSLYDCVVIGGSIHSTLFSLRGYVIKAWSALENKRVAIMVTSGADDMTFINEVMKKSFPPALLGALRIFPVGGRYILKKFNCIDRNLIRLVAFFIRDPEVKAGMLKERDDVEKARLKDLLQFVTS